MGLEKNNSKIFASIISEKPFIRVKTEETNPEAIKREYEVDGKAGVKYELAYDNLSGYIKDIQIYKGDFGKQLQVTVDDIVLSVPLGTGFADDLLKKLPAVNLSEPVNLVPYNFEDEKRRPRKGITVYQGEEKINNFFWDGEKSLYDYPDFPDNYESFDSEDWKEYFIKVSKFLQQYLKDNVIPKLNKDSVVKDIDDEDDIDVSTIPF